ncbi:serine/threonine-protein phosphatase [Klebsiella quasipneumoniae]|uniref:PP2C family protein-serine/threonine phosphatase n=1 Tax=Klebsiella quasipneumoniae TaxID=1463165 RepID=UPI001F4DD3C9|nr:PP2C family serine/threonine-protein phosphatase [Klebsiella quasipneumoniae]MCH9429603.1 serine/threonine-protein phosphatase [Klebsiella quasipneumoniae]
MEHYLELVEAVAFSHPKSYMEENEDAILPALITKNAIFIALADGVGGSNGGSTASNIAISTVRREIIDNPDCNLKDIFNKVSSNINIEAEKQTNKKDMATTLVICKITSGKVEIASAGDSRAYLIEGKSANKLTTDHTKKQELIDSGIFKSCELKGHYSGNLLTNSLRANKKFKVDIETYESNSGSIVIVSDGVYEYFDGTRIVGNSSEDNLLQVCSKLKKRVLKKGPHDDFSLVAVRFKSGCKEIKSD